MLGAKLTLGSLIVVAACTKPVPQPEAPKASVQRLELPAVEGARAFDLAETPDGLFATWMEPDGQGQRLVISRLAAEKWLAPSVVASGEDLVANWADAPRIAHDSVALVVSWPQTDGVHIARSADGGSSWTELGRLHSDDSETEHGFVSFAMEREGLRAFWLDGQATASKGPMQLRTALIGAEEITGEQMLDERVCDCCATAAAPLPGGSTLVVYRDRSDDEIRDIYALRIPDAQEEGPKPVWHDNWKIAGCPVNGPAVGADGEFLAVAWFTILEDRGHVRANISTNGGFTFGEAVDLETGTDVDPLGRVDLEVTKNGLWVTWMTVDGSVRLARYDRADEKWSEPATVAATPPTREGGFPRMEATDDGLVLLWVDKSGELSSGRIETELGTE